MKNKTLSLLIAFIFLSASFAVLNVGAQDFVTFSREGGFYDEGFNLSLSAPAGYAIYYTTDGSEPSGESFLYTSPIPIGKRGDTPLIDHLGERGYVMPEEGAGLSYMVIKAKAISGGESLKTITNTYFIDFDERLAGLPIMSATCEPSEFLNMYKDYLVEHEPQMFVEFFSPEHVLGFKHSARVKIAGHSSRYGDKKSIRFNFSKGEWEGDGEPLSYDAIPDTRQNFNSDLPVTTHAKLNMRLSDWTGTTLREALAQKTAAPLRPDTANLISAIMFINGEFWGIYDLREQYDNSYIAQHYGLKKSEVVMLALDYDTENEAYPIKTPLYYTEYKEGPKGGEEKYFASYMEMYDLMTSENIDDPEVYARLCEVIDIDNFIDYFISYIFLDNPDWPGNNVKMWRHVDDYDPEKITAYGADGRWRWFIHDFDIAFNSAYVRRLYEYTGSFDEAHKEEYDPMDIMWPEWATRPNKNILNNKEFRDTFAARYLTYLSTYFSTNVTYQIFTELKEKITAAVELDFARWSLGCDTWQACVDYLENYIWEFYSQREGEIYGRAEVAPEEVADYFQEFYDDEEYAEYNIYKLSNINFIAEGENGWFDVDGAQIRPEFYPGAYNWVGQYFDEMPLKIKAIPNKGYVLTGYTVERAYVPAEDCGASPLCLCPGPWEDITITAHFEKRDIIMCGGGEAIKKGRASAVDIHIENTTSAALSPVFIAACYDDEGRMLDVSLNRHGAVSPGAVADISESALVKDDEAKTVKLFLFDGGPSSPIIDAVELAVSQ